LLAPRGKERIVVRSVLYDDLDPACLVGGIDFHSDGYQRLSALCRTERLHVIGDVHTHPSREVGQSLIDRENPMLSRAGHVALILPFYAQGNLRETDIGLYRYLGSTRWEGWTGPAAARRLYVGRWP